ncbi:MAG: S53 family peptidase [Solirubrobacteraceae bacterium]
MSIDRPTPVDAPGRALRLARVMALCAIFAALALTLAPRSARAASVTWLGAAPAGRDVALVLPLRADTAGLDRFAQQVSTPGSPLYHRYESISELAARFGAPTAARTRVVRYLRRAGATSVKIDVTGLFADATMPVHTAQRLFGAFLADFRSAQASSYMAPVTSTRIPAALRSAVTGVVGLDTQPLFAAPQIATAHGAAGAAGGTRVHRFASHATSPAAESGYAQRTGTASGCPAALAQSGFTPNQYLTAYDYAPLQASGVQGQGERVALIEIDGFRYSDLRHFADCFDLATPAINGYGVGLKHPLAPGGESTLDLEVLDAAAPQLRAIDVYESRPSAVDVLHSLTAPLTNRGSKPEVISASLGSCEADTVETIGRSGLRAVEGALAEAAASGISVVASSGDAGSSACLTSAGKPLPATAVSYPASSPWVTGVGGTNISLNAANQIASQEVWNDSPLVAAAGGGGVSSLFSRPRYQNGVVSGRRREVPDVSMLADVAPGYEIYCTTGGDCGGSRGNPWTQVGGTSAAAPLLAGGLALVDQELRTHGRQDLGLINPLLYQIAGAPFAAKVLSDVTVNDNDLGPSVAGHPFGCCTAGPGYDDASGLGSVDLGALAFIAGASVPKVVAVGLGLPRQRNPVAAGRLRATVSCSGRCLMGAYVHIRIGRSGRLINQRSRSYLLRRAGRRTISIPLDRPTRLRLRAALAAHQRISAIVYGTVLDPSGNIDARTRGRRLKISG